MQINFDIGSADLGSVNAFYLSKEDDLHHFEKIKGLVLASKILFSKTDLQLRENGYNLTLFFKDAYASFNLIFKSSAYLDFKSSLTSIYPDLVEQFSVLERKVLIKEELNNSLYELQDYERYGFFGSKEYIDTLKERIRSLEKRLI
jgi:hypothetical protein